MDTITHSLIGALSIRAGALGETEQSFPSRRQLLLAGAVAAAFPDIDYLGMPLNTLSFIADWHRGPTHSLVMIPVWAGLLGWVFCRVTKQKKNLLIYTLVAAAALFSHILTDIITAWGTQIFWPLSDYRMALATSFIIDPIFSAIVIIGLAASLFWNRKYLAIAGLLVLAAYIGIQGIIKTSLETVAERHAENLGLKGFEVTVLPQPLAPFNWSLIITDGDSYHLARANILLSQAIDPPNELPEPIKGLLISYLPVDRLQWDRYYRHGNTNAEITFAKAAWQQDEFARFRRFARIPMLYKFKNGPDESCAWFADLRYILPSLNPPFKYGMCRNAASIWRLDQI